MFHVPARAAGKGDGGDDEEIAIHVKGLPRGWSGYSERRAKPQRHVVSVLERERARQSNWNWPMADLERRRAE